MKKAFALFISVIMVFLSCSVVLAEPTESGSSCQHEWVEYSETEKEQGHSGKHCTKCNADYCTVNGHTEEKPATCTHKAVCSVCGEEFGELGEHQIQTTTDCSKDVICSECGSIIQKGGNHDFAPATCKMAKTCRVCGATEGEPLMHRWSVGIITEEPTALTPGSIRYVCEDCGEIKNQAIYASSDENNSNKPVVIAVIIGVAVLAVIGAAIYFMIIRPKQNGEKKTAGKRKTRR